MSDASYQFWSRWMWELLWLLMFASPVAAAILSRRLWKGSKLAEFLVMLGSLGVILLVSYYWLFDLNVEVDAESIRRHDHLYPIVRADFPLMAVTGIAASLIHLIVWGFARVVDWIAARLPSAPSSPTSHA